jgi:uncharacterized protein YbjT (DUF2867 family)
MTGVPQRTIVVMGATGTIGRGVVGLLAGKPGVAVRTTTRRPGAPAGDLRSASVTEFGFDWEAPSGLDDLLAGADAVLIVPPSARPALPTTARVAAAAVAAGVRHLVFLSTLGADFKPGYTFGRWSLAGERTVALTPLPYTVLRPNSYMSNFVGMLRPAEDGSLRLPWGDGANSFVDPGDVSACAARILLDPHEHAGRVYLLTGPEALDATAVAAVLGETSGAPIHFVDTPPESVESALIQAGIPAPTRNALLELHAVMASGARSEVTHDVQTITGHAPRSLAQFAAGAALSSEAARI